MSATRTILKAITLLAALGLLAACDDEEKTVYMVTVHHPENVRIVPRHLPSKDRKNPQVIVGHPPEVEVEPIERPDDEKVYKFIPIVFSIFLAILFVARQYSRNCDRSNYPAGPSLSPVYQRA